MILPATRVKTTTVLKVVQEAMADHGRRLIEAKNRDYGDHANSDPFANFRRHGLLGIIVRMDDKLARLSTFAKTGSLSVKDEGFIDTCVDLMNYAAIAVAFELDNQARKQEEAKNEVSQRIESNRAGSVSGSGVGRTASEGLYPADGDGSTDRVRGRDHRVTGGDSGGDGGANPETAKLGHSTIRNFAVERIRGKSIGDFTVREVVDCLVELGCRP